MGVGARIEQKLKEKNMTAKKLADETGIPVSTLYSIIKRDNETVKPVNLLKIAEAFEADMLYLAKG